MIRFYQDAIREDATELGDSLANVCAPLQQELNIAERVVVYNYSDMSKIARIDERDEERRKWKAYHRTVRKYSASVSKDAFSKDVILFKALNRLSNQYKLCDFSDVPLTYYCVYTQWFHNSLSW